MFPLYESLINGLPKKDLSIAQKKDFLQKVNTLEMEGRELFYALIQCYHTQQERRNNVLLIPYKGKMLQNGVEFDLIDFPVGLRHVLYRFLIKHEQKMKEDAEK